MQSSNTQQLQSPPGINPVRERARTYLSRGWAIVQDPYRQKGAAFRDWQNVRIDKSALTDYFPDSKPSNIGVLPPKPWTSSCAPGLQHRPFSDEHRHGS